MVAVTEKLAKSNPEMVKEVYRLLAQSKRAAGLPKAGKIDFLPVGFEACRPGLRRSLTMRCSKASLREKSTSANCSNDTTRALVA